MSLSNLNLSLKYKRNPKIIVVQPITSILRKISINFVCTKIAPTRIVGIEEIIILKKDFYFSKT